MFCRAAFARYNSQKSMDSKDTTIPNQRKQETSSGKVLSPSLFFFRSFLGGGDGVRCAATTVSWSRRLTEVDGILHVDCARILKSYVDCAGRLSIVVCVKRCTFRFTQACPRRARGRLDSFPPPNLLSFTSTR